MNRLQKKCFLASAGMHGLLLCVILFGSAFFVREDKVDKSFHQITVYDPSTVSDVLSTQGGAQTAVVTPPAQPQVPQPQPQPPQVKPQSQPKPVEPQKRLETPKVAENKKEKIQDKELQPVKKPSSNKVASDFSLNNSRKKDLLDDASLKRVTHKAPKNQPKTKPKDDSDAEAEAQYKADLAKYRANNAKALASTLRSISKNMSGVTPVDMPGNGAGAFAAVNYDDLLASTYYNAWTAPSDVSEGTPTVQVSVTVARDGSVISAHIVRRSGVSAMDRSIQNLLDAVKYIGAFPEGAKDQQRTFKITFNLEAKRQLG